MIGLIPAAGHAERLHGLPKFLLPVGESYLLDILCRRMKAAGAGCILIGANSENYDLVLRYKPDGAHVYCVDSATMSETVLAARLFMDLNDDVLFGMPDSWWPNHLVYEGLVGNLRHNIAAATLWEARPDQIQRLGMCRVISGQIVMVVDKPHYSYFRWAWGALAWKRDFWPYIAPEDPHVGYALQRAVKHGEYIRGIQVNGTYHDCGTLFGYAECLKDAERFATLA